MMRKNRIKSLAAAGLTGLAAILSNDNAKADGILSITNNVGITSPPRVILRQNTNSIASDGYDSLDSIGGVPAIGGGAGIYSSIPGNAPTNTLTTDWRTNSSSTPFKIKLVYDSNGSSLPSTTNFLTFGFGGTNQFQHKANLTLRELDGNGNPTTNRWDLKYLITNNLARIPLTNLIGTYSASVPYRSFQVDFDPLNPNNSPTISNMSMIGPRGFAITNAIPTSDSDGTITNVGIAVAPTNGIVTFNNITNAIYNLTNNSAINSSGNVNDTFRLYSVDNNGAISMSTNTVNVSLTNNLPTIGAIGSFSGRRGRAITNNVAMSDANGDATTLVVAQQGTNGLVSILNNTNWVYTPSNNIPAVDSFKLYASDGYGSSITNAGSVNFTNAAPTLSNMSMIGPRGRAITNAIPAGDVDGDALTPHLVVSPTNGVVNFTNGSAIYTPSNNLPMADTFKFYMSDAYSGISQTNDSSVTFTNQPLVINNDSFTRTFGLTGNKVTISDLLTNDVDPNGFALRFNGLPSFVSTNGVPITNFNNYIYYFNSKSNALNDAFQYSVTNDHGVGGTGWVTINVNNNVFGQGNPQITNLSSNAVNLTFYGIPDFRYSIQRNTNLFSGNGWKDISTNVANTTNPVIKFTDNFSDIGGKPPSAYYRLRYNP